MHIDSDSILCKNKSKIGNNMLLSEADHTID